MNQISSKNLSKNSLWSVMAALINALTGIVTIIIVGNNWHSEGVGVFSLSISIYIIISIIFNLGISQAIIYKIATAKDKQTMSVYIYSALLLSCVLGIVAGLLAYLLPPLLTSIYNNMVIVQLVSKLSLAMPLFILNRTIIGIFNANQKMKFIAFIQLTRSCTIIFGFLYIQWVNTDLLAFPIAFIISEFIIFIILIINCLINFQVSFPALQMIKELISFGWKMTLSGIFADLNYRIDILIISAYWSSSEVGIYTIASTIAKGLWLIPDAIQRVSYPLIVKLYSENMKEKLFRTLDVLIRFGTIFFILIGLFLALFIGYILNFIFPNQPDMLQASRPLYYLLPGAVLYACLAMVAAAPASSIGKPENELKRLMLTFAINIILNLILIPYYGFIGAALATTIASVTGGVMFFVYLLKKHLSFTLPVMKYIILHLAFIAIIIIITMIQRSLIFDIVAFLLCGASILFLQIILGLLEKSDQDIIKNIVFKKDQI